MEASGFDVWCLAMQESTDRHLQVRLMTDTAKLIIDLYDRHAATWDAARGRALLEAAWLDRFIGLVTHGGAILDLGCGAGEPIARHLIEAGFALTGVDSSPHMIALCRARFPAAKFHVADMRQLDLQHRFDGLLAWDSFFHLKPDDQVHMFDVFARHVTPGGALMFTSGPARGEAIGSFAGEPLYHASLDPEEYRALLAHHGFIVARHVAEDAECGGHTVWLAVKSSTSTGSAA